MSTDISSGTGEGLLTFLDWTIEKSELNRSTASALKTASRNVLSIDEDWRELDLRNIDRDDVFRRFTIRDRAKYNENSLNVYRQRFNQAVNMYVTYLDGGDWRPRQGRATAATRNGTARNGTTRNGSAKQASEAHPETNGSATQVGPAPSPSEAQGLIEYPFPIRSGVRARLVLPDDLNTAEAERVSAFIRALAIDSPAD